MLILKTYSGETISLYGFNSKTKIISEGLYYPLKNISLPFGVKESTSNLAAGKESKIKDIRRDNICNKGFKN